MRSLNTYNIFSKNKKVIFVLSRGKTDISIVIKRPDRVILILFSCSNIIRSTPKL